MAADSSVLYDYTIYSIPIIYGTFIVLESIFSAWQKKNLFTMVETRATLLIVSLTVIFNLGLKFVYLGIYGFVYQYRIFEIDNLFIYWLCLIPIQDFLFYCLHCGDHYFRFLWAVHVTHHNSTDFNFMVGIRPSVFQPVYRFIYMSPLALLGFRPIDILLTYSITQIYGFFVHTQCVRRMPRWFEAVFVSPSHHRVHHGANEIYLDKNMGMFLIIWDRIFGTFQEELEEEPVRYGLTKNPENRSPWNMIFHEFKDLIIDLRTDRSWRNRLGYFFGRPGWGPPP
jgi:sterol desaturase/sphingolipid hydroxylase (fatty acid hydroxylase superfamily)